MSFRKKYSFEKRSAEVKRLLGKYPDRVPWIVEVAEHSKLQLDKNKYLVPRDLSFGQFVYFMRKKIGNIKDEEAIFIFVNGKLCPTNELVGKIWSDEKDECGFVFCTVSKESTFGV